jgi:hypothetical protein
MRVFGLRCWAQDLAPKTQFCFGREAVAAAQRMTASRLNYSLASQLGNHGEQWHIERNYDAADRDSKNADDDGFQHG